MSLEIQDIDKIMSALEYYKESHEIGKSLNKLTMLFTATNKEDYEQMALELEAIYERDKPKIQKFKEEITLLSAKLISLKDSIAIEKLIKGA